VLPPLKGVAASDQKLTLQPHAYEVGRRYTRQSLELGRSVDRDTCGAGNFTPSPRHRVMLTCAAVPGADRMTESRDS
jgi:hypothetical protein